jgi:hypothetical protein
MRDKFVLKRHNVEVSRAIRLQSQCHDVFLINHKLSLVFR